MPSSRSIDPGIFRGRNCTISAATTAGSLSLQSFQDQRIGFLAGELLHSFRRRKASARIAVQKQIFDHLSDFRLADGRSHQQRNGAGLGGFIEFFENFVAGFGPRRFA